jgi:1,4-dihydroxy-2-naphthoate octaprenyltransferase
MTFLAYWIGALLASGHGKGLNAARFWAGYGVVFLLEAATVFTNDRLDYDTDSRNPNWGPFNGGSRALLGGGLTPRALWFGSLFALAGAGVLGLGLVATSAQPWTLAPFLLVATVVSVGYTAPPLRLCHRTLGELDVALTHSFMAIMAGRIFQNAPLLDTSSFWIAAPMFLAILPSIALSAIPDRDADAEAGNKKTLAVTFGIGAVYRLAAVVAVLAAVAALITQTLFAPVYGWLAIVAIMIHALWLARTCLHQGALNAAARRIDALMVVALTFILWFCVTPLFSL